MRPKGLINMAKSLGGVISKNSPTILTALGVGGLITTVIFASKATPTAIRLLEEERYEKGSKLTVLETIGATWKVYIPAAAIGIATIGCIIGANHISLRRNAALASLYGLTEAAFKEYKDKVTETIGANKELKMRDDIASDHVRRNPPTEDNIILTGYGTVLCREDSVSGQYFRSDIEKIRRSINDVNQRALTGTDMWVNLNDIYYEWGINQTELGHHIGWDLNTDLVDISPSSTLSQDGEPCLVISFRSMPKFYK